MNQLYITDLDHTFLHSSKKVTQFSKDIWNHMANETLLTVATARSFGKTQEFLEGMHLKAPLILSDGAMIVTSTKKLIDINTLNKEIVNTIINEGKKFDIEPFVISLDDKKSLKEKFAVPSMMNPIQSQLINKSYTNDPRVEYQKKMEGADNTLKVVYMGEEKVLKPLAEHLQNIFSNAVEIKLSPESYSGYWFLTILHPLGDKAHAIKKLSDYLGISLSQTTVFGDSINDIEMFKIAGTSIAVSNALDIVKKEASIILPHSNDEDAVAHYLQSIKS